MVPMPSKRCAFKHNDAARLIRATKAGLPGCKVKGLTLKLPDGTVVTVQVEEGATGADQRAEPNDWDGVLKDNAPDEVGTS
jgi:hypothetical protein